MVRQRFPISVAKFGLPEFTGEEKMYIRMMVPLAMSEHSYIHSVESNDTPYEQTTYRKFFTEMILKQNGKCCFTEEEFTKIKKG